jgi:hypothetical protein
MPGVSVRTTHYCYTGMKSSGGSSGSSCMG